MPKQNNDQRLKNILSEDAEEAVCINLEYSFEDGALPIHYACLYNSLNFFTRGDLLSSQLNIPGGLYGSTPLMFTMYNLSHKAALFLLLNGADILARNNKSSDVLSICVRFDNLFGLILLLSFVDSPLSVNRYLRYAEMKSSWLVWKFLRRKRREIEKNGEEKKMANARKEYFKKFLQMAFLILLALIVPAFRIFISGFFTVTYFAFISTEIPLFFNFLYSTYAYYVLLSSNLYYFILVFMHCITLLVLLCFHNKHKGMNRLSEIKEVVTDLVLEDKYTKRHFCYTCLNTKEEKTKHCRVCDRCVLNQSHHCPFMNKCISKGMMPLFWAFVVLSVVLYISGVVNSPSKVAKFEFFICFLVSSASVIMLLLNFFSCNQKDKILMT